MAATTTTTTTAAAVDMIESAKRKAAFKAVDDHFDPQRMQFVGIGSGSTIIYGVEAIKAKMEQFPPPDGRYIFFVRHHHPLFPPPPPRNQSPLLTASSPQIPTGN